MGQTANALPVADNALPRDSTAPRHLQDRANCPPIPRLVINGRFTVQAVTGVQRVAHEVVREIDRMLEDGTLAAQVTLLCPPGRRAQPLHLRRIATRTVGKVPGVWWEQFILPAFCGGATLLCLGNSAPVLSLIGSDRVAVMVHDLSYLDYPKAYRLRYRIGHWLMLPLLLRRACRIFTVSRTERERIERLYPRGAATIAVVPNGGWVDEPIGDPAAAAAPTPPLPARYALYVGSLSHRKNFGRILQTAIRLAREDGLDFVFAGSSGTVLKQPAFRVPPDVVDRIHFIGQVNDRALLGRIYAGADVLVFPSLYEASPLPPLEAAHFGCPVVASNIPSMWERCGESVAYCDPLSVDSILRAVRMVITDPVERERQRRLARQRTAERTWGDQARTILTALFPHAALRPLSPTGTAVGHI